ncbi:MAG: hypothetical protein DCC57_24875 [Chloroflexi bacterium]|nr:MAG: hypothetical protein DCC57_24875 [Chloroflexota bacterium]
MRKLWAGLFLSMLLLPSFVLPLQAEEPPKLGDCPAGFDHWHRVGEAMDGDHKHVGSDLDLNGDGWLCGKHVGPNGSIHVHVDNNVPWK